MPNPILPRQTFEPLPERVPTEHNGILAWVPGGLLGGRPELPPARDGELPERHVVLDVPDIGPVRVTYRLSSYRHGKSRNWHWAPVWAEEVGVPGGAGHDGVRADGVTPVTPEELGPR